MSVDNPKAKIILLIHTDKYAGNFEREMCGYVTGMYGECGVGEEEALVFQEDMSDKGLDPDMFDDIIAQEVDDNGCHRPASIWNGKDETGYKTVAIFFDEMPDADQTIIIRDRAHEYGAQNKIKIKKLSIVKRKVTVVETETAL